MERVTNFTLQLPYLYRKRHSVLDNVEVFAGFRIPVIDSIASFLL